MILFTSLELELSVLSGGLSTLNLVNAAKINLLIIISIITQVIIEILALSLAENGVIFRYNHLPQGDYSGRKNFPNCCVALFVDVYEEEIN